MGRGGYPYSQAAPLSSERFPLTSTSFNLAQHSRTASSSSSSRRSSTNSESARAGAATGGGGTSGSAIPRTSSSSTWGDYTHDVELLLGEEGRGMSPSRNGPRSATPSRTESQQQQSRSSSIDSSNFPPSTPRSSKLDDQDTTPKGQTDRPAAPTSASSSSRPLHTPPQMFPSSTPFGQTSFDSPASSSRRHRLTSQTSSSSALRPRSAHSHSSTSSTYSLEDNSWATEFAPSQQYDDEVASPRAPLFATENNNVSGISRQEQQAQARPLSEFDFAAAYARSENGNSLPSSPMMPTVGIVQPASPVAPSPTRELFDGPESTTSTTSIEPKGPIASASTSVNPTSTPTEPSTHLLQTNETTTPSSSRAPSPTPSLSLSPNNRPSSRASSNRSVSSPVRPPRRVASNISLVPKVPTAGSSSQRTVSPTPSASSVSFANPTGNTSTSTPKKSPSSSPNPPNQSSFSSPKGSPRPPSVPEKSRRRASTLGLGLRRTGTGSESREFAADAGGGDDNSRPSSIVGGQAGKGITATGFSNPNTPLSASDFADVYGKLDSDDPEWDSQSQSHSATSSPKARSNASSSSPSSSRSKPTTTSRHTRDAASGFSLDPTSEAGGGIDEFGNEIGERKMHDREETIKASDRGGNDVFGMNSLRQDSVNANSNGGAYLNATTPEGSGNSTSRSTTPKGDAKARAAAFIADLKRSRQEAERAGNASQDEPGRGGVDEDETIKLQASRDQGKEKERSRLEKEEEDTVKIAPTPVRDERPEQVLPKPISRASESSIRSQPQPQPPPQPQPQSRSQPSSRSSTLPFPSQPSRPTGPPLLRRRPLPMAIQATGELTRARTAGERARIYAKKINELNREQSRLDEWIDAMRKPHSAVGRATLTSPVSSPLRSTRSFRQDASTATFAPRGDGYRAKEIVSTASTFGPRDLQPTNTPYPGVLSYTSNLSSTTSISSQRSLGSGLPAVSAQPGSSSKSFFSRSLGRRASKREPPSSSHHASNTATGGGGVSGLPISNPSPLLYSSSSATTTAPQNLRPIGGPRMPGSATVGPKLNSRASFDSRTPTATNSPRFPQQQSQQSTTNVPSHAHRTSFSLGPASTPTSFTNSPNSFTTVSTSPSPLLNSSTPLSGEEGIDEAALARLMDVLPQASRQELVKSLKKAGGGDDILAISIYLSEREAGLK
ncbi:uncharacterized protein JCM6883_005182 [Sporobolomyces salmoneus]|uniref:uncharacterized protein n=1 Tax=Sporobolomyces salmoneus TaxID=183962 RepID=UPI003176282B